MERMHQIVRFALDLNILQAMEMMKPNKPPIAKEIKIDKVGFPNVS